MADISYHKVLVLELIIVIYRVIQKRLSEKFEMKNYLGMNLAGPDLNALTNVIVTGQ